MCVPSEYELENNRNMPIYYTCPGCGKEKSFQRYVNIKSSIQVDNNVGKCKNQKSCGYWFFPVEFFNKNGNSKADPITPTFIQNNLLLKTLKQYEQNNFFLYLTNKFGEVIARNTMIKYSIGTSKLIGATIFWQIDYDDKIRTGRIILFDAENGKTNNTRWQCDGWVHREIDIKKFNLRECLFGENLIKKDLYKSIVVARNERDAIIGSILYPDLIWTSLPTSIYTPDFHILNSVTCRNVIWFPNLNKFERLRQYRDGF